MVYASYCASYPKVLCVRYEVNIWFTCCMTSLLLELSIFFHVFHASCDLTSSSKNRKMKINQKGNENGNKKIRKAKSTFCNLDIGCR